jgi:sigma-B regulation protein RsbU (phosphoserine phosphatase)
MFLIEEGAVHLVEIGKTLGKGELLGEMGLLCPSKQRTLSAVCTQDGVLGVLSRDRVFGMMEKAPRDFFAVMQLAIERYSVNLQNETAARTRLESELQIARQIQASSLPDPARLRAAQVGFGIAASMAPAKEVGGDFYDFFPVGSDTWFMAVGDVSGKGVPAALFMMTIKTLLKAEAMGGRAPAEILERVNRIVIPDNAASMFVTILCATVNLKTGRIVFGNAGHFPPFLKRGGEGFRLVELPPSPVLGLLPAAVFTASDLHLQAGDTVFLYTDGVTEATNQQGDFFGEEQLGDVLGRTPAADLEGVLTEVASQVAAFAGQAPQSDDRTMLAFRLKAHAECAAGPGPSAALPRTESLAGADRMPAAICRLPAALDSLPAFQAFVGAWGAQNGLDAGRLADLELAIEEVLANIVRYAYPDTRGDVEMQCHSDSQGWQIEFIDSGIAFDVTAVPDPVLGSDVSTRQVGGLGVFLIRKLSDKVAYRRERNQNHLLLTVLPERPTAG